MQRLVRVFPPLRGSGLYRCVFPGPEKTQAGDDEADLEKLQELLVKAHFIIGLGSPQDCFILGKNNEGSWRT